MLLMLSVLYVKQAAAQKENHKDYADTKIAECNACHKSEGIAPNHDGDWTRSHRTLASRPGNNCSQCHDQHYCLDCHKGGGINADLSIYTFGRDYAPRSHRSDFINLHPIKALDNPQTCYRCHDQKQCSQCHDRFPKGNMRIKSHLGGQNYLWTSEHASEARRNLQSCQTCHPDGDVCMKCHASTAKGGSGINPHPRSFKGNNIKDRSDRACIKCHYLR